MANSYPLNNYPFNRIIKSKNIDQSEETVTITGQLIVLPFVYPIEEESYDLFVDDSILNPQFLKPCYLLRYELEELSSKIFYYLKNSKKRSGKDILRGTQILREEIWDTWDYLITSEEDDDNPYDPSRYFTGSQIEKIGLKNFRSWSIFYDPVMVLESMEDNWLEQKKWRMDVPWTYAELYVLLSLWMIDESAVYLNQGNIHKATFWLVRAIEKFSFRSGLEDSDLAFAKKELAKLGGTAKNKRYDPLKKLVIERVNTKNYPSRRNAAISLTPEVLEKAKELGIYLSADQAVITITSWLKAVGLPANI